MEKGSSREVLLAVIESNPGLHFRELQRRTGLAVGQLEYHLYQMEKDRTIVSRRDGRLLRYFSNISGNALERNLSYHLRSKFSRDLLMELLRNKGNLTLSWKPADRKREALETMAEDSILSFTVSGNRTKVELVDYDTIRNFLIRNREKFLDSLASSLINLFDQS